MLIDITRTIGIDTLAYPGDAGPDLQQLDSLAQGAAFNYTHLSFSAHCGTHLDAPSHFIAGGQSIAELPLSRFRIPAYVVSTGNDAVVTVEHIKNLPLIPGEAVLFKTRNAQLPRNKYSRDYTYLSGEVAKQLAEWKAGLVGIDYLSVDGPDDSSYPAHMALLGTGVLILEDAMLDDVAPGKYQLTCYPLRLSGVEASPCRAVLET